VIHAVGRCSGSMRDGRPSCSRRATTRAIELAAEKGLSTLAFSRISTGIYGYPREEAAAVASRAIREALVRWRGISEVRLVFYSPSDEAAFLSHHEFGEGV